MLLVHPIAKMEIFVILIILLAPGEKIEKFYKMCSRQISWIKFKKRSSEKYRLTSENEDEDWSPKWKVWYSD